MLRKSLQKTLLVAVLLMLAVSVYAPTAAQSLSGTITVLSHRTDLDQDGTLARYSEEFKALYPDVTVNWETITDYAGEVATRLNTTDYGDVLNIPPSVSPDKFPDFFSPLGTVEELGEKYNFINEGAYDGTVYGIATTGNAQGLLYNKEIFEAAGITEVPTTPDDFIAALKLIKENTEAIPLYTNYSAGWPLTQWNSGNEAFSANADYLNLTMPHTDAPFAEGEPFYQSYKLLFDAVKNGYTEVDPTTTDWEQSKVMIANGEIGVMALGSWAITQMQAAAVDAGKDASIIGYMPYPISVDGKQYAGAGGDYKIAVNKNSPNQEIATAFVTWFLEESNFAYDQGGIPPLLDAELPPAYAAFAEAGVIYIVDTPAIAGEEGLLNNIDNEAEIGWNNGSGVWQSTIVDAARGQTSDTFDDIMNAANAKWAEARVSLGVTP
jgi:raffinose/stachyose/melibiose transport system substrate-binding protein